MGAMPSASGSGMLVCRTAALLADRLLAFTARERPFGCTKISDPVTLVEGTEPRGLVQLHDLMVCSTGAAASLGVHGNAAVAARNLEPCFVVERNMRQHQPWCSESPTSDILASQIVADQPGRRRPPSYCRPRGTGILREQRCVRCHR